MQRAYWLGFIVFFFTLSCTFTQKVKTGMQAYSVRQYSVAADLFTKEYEESNASEEKARLAFLAGESYRFLNDYGSAGNWYIKAYKDGYGDKALESYAAALKHQERYQEALNAYEDLYETNPGNAGYRSEVTLARQAMEWSSQPNKAYTIKSVAFNSTGADYSAQPLSNSMIMFTSDRGSKPNQDTYLWTGRSYSDIFISNKNTAQVAEFDASINTDDNEGTPVLSPDGNTLVFTRCFVKDAYDAWCKLMISQRRGDGWTEAEALPFVKEKINYGHPAFAANGTVLFFSSDAPEGQGGHDLYFSQKDATGNWAEPINLGPLINTAGEELYPTVFDDTLYYSSDKLPGLGGLDIFKTYIDHTNQWVAPVNLRAPVNSGADDFGYVLDTFSSLPASGTITGYFTSSREGFSRNDEIYSFTLKAPTVVVEDVVTEEKKPEESDERYQVFLAVRVLEPVYEDKDDPNSRVVTRRPLPNGPVILTTNVMDERFVSDELGQALLKLEWNKEYTITARYRDHLASSVTIKTGAPERNPKNPIKTINQSLVLEPIFKDKEIELENIFYDYDQWFIRDDAKPSLDQLAQVMKTNPTIRIQLSSHTDCRGTDEYNLDLSQKRAQAAIDYLISTGIPSNRLQAQGFGEANLAVRCECETCTEDQHQKNRRTTFKIID